MSDENVNPDYEAAARALGFCEIDGVWYHPNDRLAFVKRFKSAEEIFVWWGRANGDTADQQNTRTEG